MQKWPDVPNVFGWLRLDRRGNWLVKSRSGEFGRIANPALCEFIGRNYAADELGRWYFQNGPQRVFVTLDYTPFVFRLDDSVSGLISQTGHPAGAVSALCLDEAGALLVHCVRGAGVVQDRDLAPFIARLIADNPALADEEAFLATAARGGELHVFGSGARIGRIDSGRVAARFGFDPCPVPPPGQPDC